MEIGVLVKNSPDRVGILELNNDGKLIKEAVPFGLGIWDLMAVEEGLYLRDRFGGSVTVLTLGSPEDEECLREAVALGADRAVRVEEKNAANNPRQEAMEIFNSGVLTGFDFILGGMRSSTNGNGLVLTYLGALMGIPVVSGVVRIEKGSTENSWRIFRNAGKGDRWILEGGLPVVLGIEKSVEEPRYPTMYGRLAAEKCQIAVIQTPGEVSEDETINLIKVAAAKAKPKKIFTPDSNLSAADRMKMILSGGISKKKSAAGPASGGESGAKQILDFLQQTKVI